MPSASQAGFAAMGLAREMRLCVAAGKSQHCTWERPAIHDKTDSLSGKPLSAWRLPLVASRSDSSVGSDQLGLPQVGQANAVLGLLDLALAVDWSKAHTVQSLLVAHDGADEHRRTDHGAQLGA